VRPAVRLALVLLLLVRPLGAQSADTTSQGDKTFLTKRDLAISGIAFGATALLSIWDDDIAIASQKPKWQKQSTTDFANTEPLLPHPSKHLSHDTRFLLYNVIASRSPTFMFVDIPIALGSSTHYRDITHVSRMAFPTATALQNLGAFIFGHHPLHL